ncbi:MAG TPA: NADH-ubiquinone oxidoreductase-F iron-sulfur binding region domain-containing protein [Methylocystis sp.]|nr:NADH-ubiquinone oxidoreductase-F iron-sulfur binding region domain-containing protein [Methylocystis sp.]
MTRVFVPLDMAAKALGADRVVAAIAREAAARGADVEIVRNGSRGLLWLEPLVEVETPDGRTAYGNVKAADVASLFDADFLSGAKHSLSVGKVEDHPYWKRQNRITFKRCGIIDPLSLAEYEALGGGKGLARAFSLSPADCVAEVAKSGLRGRGGAGFPTGIKWKTVADTPADRRYVVVNADEGDSGTFADRMIMEGDPFALIEGMTICGYAVGASKGYVYLRSEYPQTAQVFGKAIEVLRAAGWLGKNVRGSDFAFDVELRIGAGAYVCGEETSLLESLEGKRGIVRAKPPFPAIAGLFDKPTVVNNVLSIATIPMIFEYGAQHYADCGVGRSRGTMPLQIAGNVKYGGLCEVDFGLTLGEIVNDIGGGAKTGRPVRAVQCGGPLGAYVPVKDFDMIFDYEAFTKRDALIGHGGLVVFDDTVDMLQMARFGMEFCAIESCGKCTPCRIGSTRGVETIDKIGAGQNVDANIALLEDLCQTMKWGSLCALGGFAPYPVLSALRHFPEDFRHRSLPAAAE